MNIDINRDKAIIGNAVSSVLADTYTLYLKTQNYHWNVTGARFHQLHKLFEEQYTEMAEAIDEIAERVRSLGFRPPGTFKEFLALTSIPEETVKLNADEMIKNLADGHEMISSKTREIVVMAHDFKDDVTADLLTSRIKTHEKTTWMLKSFLE